MVPAGARLRRSTIWPSPADKGQRQIGRLGQRRFHVEVSSGLIWMVTSREIWLAQEAVAYRAPG